MTKKTSYVYCLHLWSILYLGRQKLNPLRHNTKIMICILSSEILIYHLWHKEPEVILLMYHPKHLQYFQLLSISIRVFSTDKNKMNPTVIHLYCDNFLNIILFWNAEIFTIYQEKSFSHFVSPPFHLRPKIRNKSSQIYFSILHKFCLSQNLEVRVNTTQGRVLFMLSHLRKRFLSGQI